MLARCLEKTLPAVSTVPQPSTTSNANDGRVKEVIALFEEGSQITPLWQRAQNHIIAIATSWGFEDQLRTHLDIIKAHAGDKQEDQQEKLAADYALAQSFVRTNELDKAKPLLLAIRKQFPESECAIGAAYYLGEIDIKEKQQADTPANHNAIAITASAQKYFRQYLHSSPAGHFAKEIVNSLLKAATTGEQSITASDHELFGQVYFNAADWGDALAQWQAVDPETKLLERASCYVHLGQVHEAQAYLLKALKQEGHKLAGSYVPVAAMICQPLTRAQATDFWRSILS